MLKEKGVSLKRICLHLKISRSSFYARKSEKTVKSAVYNPQDAIVLSQIKEIRGLHTFWGYRRVWAWLKHREKIVISKKRTYRIMKENNLLCPKKAFRKNEAKTRSKPKATRPNQYWGIDMTKFMINGLGWVYLVIVLDWFTKKIVGFDLSLRSRTSDWEKALDMALNNQFKDGVRDKGLNLISDNGSQPTSVAFMKNLSHLGINQIFTTYDNPKGNAETERMMRTIKEEVIWINDFETFEEAENTIGKWILNDYNKLYIHSALNYKSPEEFENEFFSKRIAA